MVAYVLSLTLSLCALVSFAQAPPRHEFRVMNFVLDANEGDGFVYSPIDLVWKFQHFSYSYRFLPKWRIEFGESKHAQLVFDCPNNSKLRIGDILQWKQRTLHFNIQLRETIFSNVNAYLSGGLRYRRNINLLHDGFIIWGIDPNGNIFGEQMLASEVHKNFGYGAGFLLDYSFLKHFVIGGRAEYTYYPGSIRQQQQILLGAYAGIHFDIDWKRAKGSLDRFWERRKRP